MNDYAMLKIVREHHAELVREGDQRRLASLAKTSSAGVARSEGRASVRSIAIVIGGLLASSALLMIGAVRLPFNLG